MYPATGTKLSPEERKAVAAMAKERNTTISAIVREAVQAYIGMAKAGHDNGLPDLPLESRRLLREAANNMDHPLHDVAYGLLYAPRDFAVAYR